MACCSALKPRMLCNTPMAAMMAPPGTPGAATIITPNISTKPRNVPNSTGMPCINIKATAQATIFSMLPDMWMLAQSGTTNPATSSSTPFFFTCWSVTGIVAADDDVPEQSMPDMRAAGGADFADLGLAAAPGAKPKLKINTQYAKPHAAPESASKPDANPKRAGCPSDTL